MIKQDKKTFLTFLLFPLCLFLLCSKNPANNGNTTPQATGRAIVGKFLDVNNKPISSALVRLFPVDYVPSLSLSKKLTITVDTTDKNGNYRIPVADSGTFNLEGQKDSLGIFIDSVKVPLDTNNVPIPDKVLKKLGIIKGISHMPGQNDTNQVRVTLYIPGTGRITKPVIGGRFTFQDVPEGKYQIIIDPTLNDYEVKILDTMVSSGDTLDLDTVIIQKHKIDTIVINSPTVFGTWGPDIVYKVMNDIQIPDNLTLIILPKTKIVFMGNFLIDIVGGLVAIGKVDSLITFTSGQSNPTTLSWQGLMSANDNINTSDDSLILSYCIIEYATHSFISNGSHISHFVFSNNIIRNSNDGIYFPGNNFKVINNIFQNIDYAAFTTFSDSIKTVTFANNIVLNVRYGMYSQESIPNIINNNFYNIDTLGYYDLTDTISGTTTTIYYDTLAQSLGNINVNPLFVNDSIGKEDYHLQSNSPCKGTGINGTDMGIFSTYKP
jgi:hypothetical protein